MQDLLLSDLVTRALQAAHQLIQARFGTGAAPDFVLPFHGLDHTRGVVQRAVRLAQAMGATDSDTDLAGIAAAFHDTVQNWEEVTRPDGAVLRRRFAGHNEQASADEAVRWMQRVGGFSASDLQLVTDAILATVPGWNVEYRTVVQPNLHPDSPVVVRAVALADLATAGMEGDAFVHEGDPLFREEQLDIARAVRAAQTRADISLQVQEAYRTRMLQWTTSQTTFASGRKALLSVELGNLTSPARQQTEALFCQFDAAIRASEALVLVRSSLSFWDLADAMGYVIPAA
jgi:hypothetical protein